MPTLLADLRYSFRSLRKAPGFTAVAVVTLALGVGANTAVFSLLNSVFLRPLPYAQPDQLVLIWESAPFFGIRDSPVSPANYVDWHTRSRSFERMGAIEDHSFRLAGDGNPEVVDGSLVTAGLFHALRTRPALGRVFTDDDDRPGAPKVAVISDTFWRRRFGGDPQVIGKTITLSDEKYTITGVLAPGTEPPTIYHSGLGEIWATLGSNYAPAGWANRGRHNWMVVARLREGVSLSTADAELRAIGASLSREYPATNEKVGAFVAPLRDHFVTSSRGILTILLGTVAFVLLIACSNLANLLLSRAANRNKEVAVRAALGASRSQLARQFLCESLLLCAMGSGLGLLLATTTFRFLAHLAPGNLSGLNSLAVDWHVLAFTLAIAVLTAVSFGLAPLLQVRRLDLNASLKQSGRSMSMAAGSRRLRALLICAEVASAFVLLICAGLMIETFARLRGVNVGCRTSNVLTLRMPASKAHDGTARMAAYQREVLRRVTAIRGVVSAGFTNHIPLVVKGDITGIRAEGGDGKEGLGCRARAAGPGYLRAMGIPLLRGRDIDERDGESAPGVLLVNEALARTLWPGQDPIGRRILSRGAPKTVIGVVGDVRQSGLDVASNPEFYVSTLQDGARAMSLAIHTRVEPSSLAPAVRQAIWSVDPGQPITELASMEEILDREVSQRRVQTTLLTAFAGLSLLLAAIGLYGTLSYLVGQQVPEIGLRIALGAAPVDVLQRIVGQGLKLTALGIGVGLFAALGVSRLLTSVLFGVKHTNPATYAIVAVVLLTTAAIASYLPARRAMRVDPVVALRGE